MKKERWRQRRRTGVDRQVYSVRLVRTHAFEYIGEHVLDGIVLNLRMWFQGVPTFDGLAGARVSFRDVSGRGREYLQAPAATRIAIGLGAWGSALQADGIAINILCCHWAGNPCHFMAGTWIGCCLGGCVLSVGQVCTGAGVGVANAWGPIGRRHRDLFLRTRGLFGSATWGLEHMSRRYACYSAFAVQDAVCHC